MQAVVVAGVAAHGNYLGRGKQLGPAKEIRYFLGISGFY
jgi:hypothetical protein